MPASDRTFDATVAAPDVILRGVGRILVMDDEDYIRHVVADILEMLGYEAVCCEDGEKACALYQEALEGGGRSSLSLWI